MSSGHPLFRELTEEELILHDAKNNDYRSAADPLANFKRVAAWMALYPRMNWATPQGVAIIYAMKQQDAALSLLERGVEGGVENVDTRARDVHVYWKILRILDREAREATTKIMSDLWTVSNAPLWQTQTTLSPTPEPNDAPY